MTKVSLRLRQARNPKMSYYYLDFYPPVFNPATRQTRRHEYLQISRYNEPENQIEKDHNQQVDLKAEAIRSQREIEIINMEYGLFDSRVLNDDFLEFFRNEAETKHTKWHAACEHFSKYTHGKCTFGNISIELCEGFKDYLLNEATNRRTGEIINVNSASAYYCMLKCAMRCNPRGSAQGDVLHSKKPDSFFEPGRMLGSGYKEHMFLSSSDPIPYWRSLES